jgi:hypothetical protein
MYSSVSKAIEIIGSLGRQIKRKFQSELLKEGLVFNGRQPC